VLRDFAAQNAQLNTGRVRVTRAYLPWCTVQAELQMRKKQTGGLYDTMNPLSHFKG
jgi:hypothetical protein